MDPTYSQLKVILDNYYADLLAEQALYSDLNAQAQAASASSTQDVVSTSESDPEGSASFSFVALMQKLDASINRLNVLAKQYEEWKIFMAKIHAGISSVRVSNPKKLW